MTTRVLLALPTLALGLLAPGALGQSVLYTFYGDSAGDFFGNCVSGAGDVNGDGYDDSIVGAAVGNFDASGKARVFSGMDGSVLYTFDGDSAGDFFGISVSGAGDVNGDGYADVIVGAYGDDNNGPWSGSAKVFSGADGSVLYTFDGDSQKDKFGSSVSGAGDVNGDGFDDLIVGAPYDKKLDRGSAWVFSGGDGSILYTFYGDSPEDRLGSSVSGAGDMNGDGFGDLLVGAPFDDKDSKFDNGSAQVFSGKDGSVLYTFFGDSSGDFFGYSVSGAGDVNGDGYDEVIVGAFGDDNNGNIHSGSAQVFSGFDGTQLYIFNGDSAGDAFGVSVSGAGDVNGDGYTDVIVGATGDNNNGSNAGSARTFSGVDGSILYTFNGDSADDWFGFVSGAGDVNGDGYDDVIVGAPLDDDNGNSSGSARVIAGSGVIGTNYCGPANLNSTGQSAVITATGSEVVQANLLTLTSSQLPQHQFGHFLNSQTQGFVPFAGGSQGNLCLAGSIGRYNRPGEILSSGAGGTFSLVLDLTDTPQPTGSVSILAGETWNFQAWFRDNNPGPTSNFTDGVSITFS